MNVLLLPADESACREYRLTYPSLVAKALGATAEVRPPVRPKHTTLTGLIPVEIDPGDADVVVIQRPAFRSIVDLIPRLQGEGRAVVVDIDDDLSQARPDHPWARAKEHLDPAQQERACALADLLTCTTPALAERYGPHGRVAVLPNFIPASRLELPRDSDGQTIGWAGSAGGHPGDLAVTGGAVDDVLRKEDWQFKIIGDPETVRRDLELSVAPQATGGLPFEDYHLAVGTLDVGIVPLADTPFNRAKSWLKGLEYAARGVPFVASALPEYERLAAHGVGLLARDPRQWRRQLTDLARDETLRFEQAELGRQFIAEKASYETQGILWLDAWEAAITNRKERPCE